MATVSTPLREFVVTAICVKHSTMFLSPVGTATSIPTSGSISSSERTTRVLFLQERGTEADLCRCPWDLSGSIEQAENRVVATTSVKGSIRPVTTSVPPSLMDGMTRRRLSLRASQPGSAISETSTGRTLDGSWFRRLAVLGSALRFEAAFPWRRVTTILAVLGF